MTRHHVLPTVEQARQWKRSVRRAHNALTDDAVARTLEQPAADLVAAAGVGPSDRVLDLGAGDGNIACAAAGRGAAVTACDFSERQVALGRDRAAHAVTWLVADAEHLPFGRARFTHVVSNFGVMYAPDPRRAIREAFRVLAPGGRFAVTAHTPDSFHAETESLLADYAPPTMPTTFPVMWGEAEVVRSWLAPYASRIDLSRHAIVSRAASFEEFWARHQASASYFGYLRRRLDAGTFDRFVDDYRALVHRHGGVDGATFVLSQTYLRIVCTGDPAVDHRHTER